MVLVLVNTTYADMIVLLRAVEPTPAFQSTPGEPWAGSLLASSLSINLASIFLLPPSAFANRDKKDLVCPRHLYYRTNRAKVSVWSCGISDISWQLARSNTTAEQRADCEWLSRRFPGRFRIWRKK